MPQDTFPSARLAMQTDESEEDASALGEPSTCDRMTLDCYPYSFSPLLLFAPEGYFDKGHSNYNSVAQFFAGVLKVNMLSNVLYDRKNMLYEDLVEHVMNERMAVTCCIDSHFTAFQVLGKQSLIYYDPLRSSLALVSGTEKCRKFAAFLLLKCSYGDNQHIIENKNYYTGNDSNPIRRTIYSLWRNIQKTEVDSLTYDVRTTAIGLDLPRWLLINGPRDPRAMSTQLTGNTCYFQTYLFVLLCKAGCAELAADGGSVVLRDVPALEDASIRVSRLLLSFFVEPTESGADGAADGVMRPLSNSNVVLDFPRFRAAPYYVQITSYLDSAGVFVPPYEQQYPRLLDYFKGTKTLHGYDRCQPTGTMPSSANTKTLQLVCDTGDSVYKFGGSNYYKYRAANLMFGFNAAITGSLGSFSEFNALRKNQLLAFYEQVHPVVSECVAAARTTNKYRDYYFMAQFEVGQRELVELHHYTYEIDLHSMLGKKSVDKRVAERVRAINTMLVQRMYFSTQKVNDYDKILPLAKFQSTKHHEFVLDAFMSVSFFDDFVGLGLSPFVPQEKEINSLTQTVFYTTELMSRQSWRNEFEFEKECINQMARTNLRAHDATFNGRPDMEQRYTVAIKIGQGVTYSKYNTLMHFLSLVQCYWQNPDLNSIQVFGKDIRALLATSCQKVFFEAGHNHYCYGPIEDSRQDLHLAVGHRGGEATPYVSREKRGNRHTVVVTDRVYEHSHMTAILTRLFERARDVRFKSDDVVLNLMLLSLMLDFGLTERFGALLNLPSFQSLKDGLCDKRQLQVEVSNWINEFDKRNVSDSITRLKVEHLIFEASYKFIVNKNFSIHSKTFELIRQLNADPVNQQYLLMCKVYMSLCQINKSVEVDYYKARCNGDYRIIIPRNFSKATSDYLDQVTAQYTFSERQGVIYYGELALFDVRPSQPEINLYTVRFDSGSAMQSMVKYVEISNVFQAVDLSQPDGRTDTDQYLIFIADNALLVEACEGTGVTIRINKIAVQVATIFFNEAISFVPCFKYAESDDVILFTSRNIHYLVDKAGQFNENYYGMKHELMECITSEQCFLDLNDEHVFKSFKLCDLLTESKTVVFFPDYLLQVQSQQQLINLLDFAVYIRNISFFILALFYLRRASIALQFHDREEKVIKISGPWKAAIAYVENKAKNTHYDKLFARQFFDLNQHEHLPLADFVEELCTYFTRYQRYSDGQYQIVPTAKQKQFLQHILSAPECFHFSEVGSGKTKVILPLLCQLFLSNNVDAHAKLARGGDTKNVLVVLVPEHLVTDARAQVFRYCLNLNFRDEYRIYDDIFALLHDEVQLGSTAANKRAYGGYMASRPRMKQIFITSFNQFKKALTYDAICAKVQPHRERILVVIDEVDDFLDADKLVFNICSNKSNNFAKETLESYFEVSRAVYHGNPYPDDALAMAENPAYWHTLYEKLGAIHTEIQDKSRSINKSFGIFNEQTLRHCTSNIAHDIEGYRSLIARPYASVNRAMPGSYYTDVERTIYLTYYILMEDVAKYDELFQQERKFISFEFWQACLHTIDYDDLVYGHTSLSVLVIKHPETKDGLTHYLYEIILRRMEVRDRSRSVNSVDVVFNFACIGFTGTPFIDNYPTFGFIRSRREDQIPDMIDRSFYVYSGEALAAEMYEERFSQFQGKNSNVRVAYVSSDFMQSVSDELAILATIFEREAQPWLTDLARAMGEAKQEAMITAGADAMQITSALSTDVAASDGFNVLVDLCGIFKKTSIYEVRDLIMRHFGAGRFHYIYHIDQADGGDRVLYVDSENDVQFDEEFYKFLCKTHGAQLRDKVFFFIDNRNVIGKDVPFQLDYQRRFGQPLFFRSVVLAHDVDDFSKIWQAMGRSRTMNDTPFVIYKSGLTESDGGRLCDIKKLPLTRKLYVSNCDRKMAGNLSSIYQTLISLHNLAQDKFYYGDEIVNVFLEKMEQTLGVKVAQLEERLSREVLRSPVPSAILTHILSAKFTKCANTAVASASLTRTLVESLLRGVVNMKFEQRRPTGDVQDDCLAFLAGEQEGTMEISYTKQQQKQKQKQHNKSQDSDTMENFDRKHQLTLEVEMDNYFAYTLTPQGDQIKTWLATPIPVEIFKLVYTLDGSRRCINVFPTIQFLYSHHIHAEYITSEVRDLASAVDKPSDVAAKFFKAVDRVSAEDALAQSHAASSSQLGITVLRNLIRRSPQYSLAALRPGVYVIGMKDQLNAHDLAANPMSDHVHYVADELGFVLYDKGDATSQSAVSRTVDSFGPYFIEQYIIMEVLSKQEVAQTVLDYYTHRKDKLQRGLERYDETQGKGFICWRFFTEFRQK